MGGTDYPPLGAARHKKQLVNIDFLGESVGGEIKLGEHQARLFGLLSPLGPVFSNLWIRKEANQRDWMVELDTGGTLDIAVCFTSGFEKLTNLRGDRQALFGDGIEKAGCDSGAGRPVGIIKDDDPETFCRRFQPRIVPASPPPTTMASPFIHAWC